MNNTLLYRLKEKTVIKGGKPVPCDHTAQAKALRSRVVTKAKPTQLRSHKHTFKLELDELPHGSKNRIISRNRNPNLLMCISVMTIFSSRFEPEDCMRTFSQSEPTRLLSSLQSASISQQHRRRCHRIQGHTISIHKYPTVSLVPCPTLLNTVPTHFTHDETQRVATKTDFRQHPSRG